MYMLEGTWEVHNGRHMGSAWYQKYAWYRDTLGMEIVQLSYHGLQFWPAPLEDGPILGKYFSLTVFGVKLFKGFQVSKTQIKMSTSSRSTGALYNFLMFLDNFPRAIAALTYLQAWS